MNNGKRLTLLGIVVGVFLILSMPGYGQYTLNADDYPALWTSAVYEADTSGAVPIPDNFLSLTGADQTWTFLQDLDSLHFNSLYDQPENSTYYSDDLAAAEWAVSNYQYIHQSAITGVTDEIRGLFAAATFERMENDTAFGVGTGIFIPPFVNGGFQYDDESVNYPFPLELETTWTRSSKFLAEDVNASFFGIPITIDIAVADTTDITVDATGTLTIPAGTFDCVRLKLIQKLIVSPYMANTTTPLIDPIVNEYINYEWRTADIGLVLKIGSHNEEEDPNFTEGGSAVRLLSSDTGIDCEPDCDDAIIPETYYLRQNYPNPFNPSTSISYDLPAPSRVEISVFTMLGQEITSYSLGVQPAGIHDVTWHGKDKNGGDLPGGIYFYRLRAIPVDSSEPIVQTRKMIFSK